VKLRRRLEIWGYFTTNVNEIGEIGRLFVEPAGVAEGVIVNMYVPLGVMTAGGGGGCTELPLLPPPQPFTIRARHASAATLFQSMALAETSRHARLRQ
jgi:hypothetical protein